MTEWKIEQEINLKPYIERSRDVHFDCAQRTLSCTLSRPLSEVEAAVEPSRDVQINQ